MMEESIIIESSSIRRWEDLSTDCLTKVFEKVGLESLIIDIPFVCKSWYKASLDPLIYKVLHFEFMPWKERTKWATITLWDDKMAEEKYSYSKLPASTEFIKIAVKRSCGMATEVVFPEFHDDFHLELYFSVSALEYLLERCPALETLILPYFIFSMEIDECLLKMISKLKHLKSLAALTYLSCQILNQIPYSLPKFSVTY